MSAQKYSHTFMVNWICDKKATVGTKRVSSINGAGKSRLLELTSYQIQRATYTGLKTHRPEPEAANPTGRAQGEKLMTLVGAMALLV